MRSDAELLDFCKDYYIKADLSMIELLSGGVVCSFFTVFMALVMIRVNMFSNLLKSRTTNDKAMSIMNRIAYGIVVNLVLPMVIVNLNLAYYFPSYLSLRTKPFFRIFDGGYTDTSREWIT